MKSASLDDEAPVANIMRDDISPLKSHGEDNQEINEEESSET
jgi:hypothetical protein